MASQVDLIGVDSCEPGNGPIADLRGRLSFFPATPMNTMMNSGSDSNDAARLDAMSLGILREKESAEFVDYVFIADVWGDDPRGKGRLMLTGQQRGLFRVDKASSRATLLKPMVGDEGGRRFERAAHKVTSERLRTGSFPEAAQYASG